jgi:hypothetical protein
VAGERTIQNQSKVNEWGEGERGRVRSFLQAAISSLCNNLFLDALYSATPYKPARFRRDLVSERLIPIVTA